MGAGLLEDDGLADLCDRCARAAGIDLRHLLTEADDDELRLTQNAQPALTFTGLALAALLRRRGIEPAAAAGHSVGEYAALAVAGALPPEDAIKAVVERGRAMADAARAGTTTMAAVLGLEPDRIAAALEGLDGVWPANFNTPAQTVIAGRLDAVEDASERLREAGARRVIPLNVSAAFHTPLMRAAAERLRYALQDLRWADAACPVIANVSGEPYGDPHDMPDLLERQLYSPVRWSDCVATLASLGVEAYAELGPKRALTGMLRELAPGAPAFNVGTAEEARTLLLQ